MERNFQINLHLLHLHPFFSSSPDHTAGSSAVPFQLPYRSPPGGPQSQTLIQGLVAGLGIYRIEAG